MDFYKKDKGPSKVAGGKPSTGVAQQATDVGPLQAAPDLAGLQNQSKNRTVTAGRSNSAYNTSTGLINALDVVQGATQIMNSTGKLMNQIDDSKLTQMQKELAEAQANETWSDPTHPEYIGEAAKFQKTKDIYGKYGDTFYTDRGRAQYEGTVAENNINEANYNYQVSIPQIESKAASMLAAGTPEESVFAWKDQQFDVLKSKYAGDPARVAAIEQSQMSAAATNAQAISSTVTSAYEQYASSGKLDALLRTLPTGMGQEAWQQAVIQDIAENNPEPCAGAIL